VTSRGMKQAEMARIGAWFSRVAEHVADEAELDRIAGEVREFCAGFPCPGIAHAVAA